MFRRLLPNEYSFFDLFEEIATFINLSANELHSYVSGKSTLEATAVKLKDIEHQADNVVHRCVESLQKTFITPIERADIHLLIKRLDDIVDSIYATISRLELYEITEILPEAKGMSALIVKCSLQVEEAVKGLRKMKNAEAAVTKCLIIHELESEGDGLYRAAIKKLFHDTDAVMILKWKDIYDKLERAIDRSEEVANIIERVVIAGS
ncbi:MAG: DUF47 family protein [Candidatus Kapabacteria bacterium]|nr:DUF47 family protein [Candidatus Kapabacteria bacterium]